MRTACPGVFRSRSKYVAKQQEIGAKPAGLKDAHKVRVYFLDSVPRPWHAKLDAKLVWPTCRHHDIQILCVSRSPNNAKTRYLRYLRYLRYRNSARNGATNDFFAFLGQKPLLFCLEHFAGSRPLCESSRSLRTNVSPYVAPEDIRVSGGSWGSWGS